MLEINLPKARLPVGKQAAGLFAAGVGGYGSRNGRRRLPRNLSVARGILGAKGIEGSLIVLKAGECSLRLLGLLLATCREVARPRGFLRFGFGAPRG